MEPIILTVHHSGLRFDRYCAQFIPQVSSLKRAKKWIKSGWIHLNGKRVETSRYVALGDQIVLMIPDEILPVWKYPIRRLWEDDHIAIVYKPPGIAVHSFDGRSLRHALGHVLQSSLELDSLVQFEPVHRLDVRTQGLMLVAKTASTRATLGNWMADKRKIQKRYQCLVIGSAQDGESQLPIDDKEAHTRWRVLNVCESLATGSLSLLEVEIFSGRTHQIRKHLSAAGHPILGDDLYNSKSPLKGKGLFLCATRLSFVHPVSNCRLDVSVSTPNKLLKRWAYEANRITKRQNIQLGDNL